MTPARLLLLVVGVLAAVLLQTTLVARLPLPGSPPDLVLVLVLVVALRLGPAAGMATGFAAGCLADLLGDSALGRLALAYVVGAWAAGLLPDGPDRGLRGPLLAAAAGSAAALLTYAAEGLLLGDPRVQPAAVALGLVSSVPYDGLLAALVVPLGRRGGRGRR